MQQHEQYFAYEFEHHQKVGKQSRRSQASWSSHVSSGLLQTAQTWVNTGICGGLCAVGVTFD